MFWGSPLLLGRDEQAGMLRGSGEHVCTWQCMVQGPPGTCLLH